MKCPQCGQWNRATLPRCIHCGQPLPQGGNEPSWKSQLKDDQRGKEYIRVDEFGGATSEPDQRDVLAREMHELKERKEAGTAHLRRLRQDSAERGYAPSGLDMRTAPDRSNVFHVQDDPRSTVRVVRRGAPQQPAATHRVEDPQQLSTWDAAGRMYDPLVEDFHDRQSYNDASWEPQPIHLPSRFRTLRRIMKALMILLMLGVTGLCIFFGVEYFRARQDSKLDVNRASVSASILDDLAAHTILIPGEDGQQIYIKELHTSYIVTGGFATIEVADHIWYDDLEELVDDSMSVTLTPYIKTASGQQKPLDTITYDITIPLSPIELVTPDSLRTNVTTAMYSMTFNVRAGSKVTINGDDVSDTVNAETGELTYNATVQPIGDNVFEIRVRSQYCRENMITVTLYRKPQEIPLDLSADTYTSTNLQSIEIRATTLPGATVNVLSPHSDLKITELDTTGAFSFMAVFDHIGYNTVSITASYPGKQTSQVDYDIYYVPGPDEYTRKAWPLNKSAEYSELLNNMKVRAAQTQVYVVVGTVAEIVSEKPQMVKIYTSDDGKSQPVLLENQTKTDWKVGEYYRIYADAYSTYDSMPWLIARYTYR